LCYAQKYQKSTMKLDFQESSLYLEVDAVPTNCVRKRTKSLVL
jgi:hypothetical protein